MSIQVFNEVWDKSAASGSTLLVLLSLADQADNDGFSWPSVDTVARRARIQKRQVLRAIDDLVALGEIEVWKYKRQGTGPDRNAYQVVLGDYAMFKGRTPSELVNSRDKVSDGKRRPIPGRVRQRVFGRDGNRCLKCGAVGSLSIDHIVPQQDGGGDDEDNLQTLCVGCNSAKGAATADYRVGVFEDTQVGVTEDTHMVSSKTPTRARSFPGTTMEPSKNGGLSPAEVRAGLWDALVEATGVTPASTGERSRFGSSVNDLVGLGAEPGQVVAAAREFARRYPGATVTDRALVNRWGELTNGKSAPRRRYGMGVTTRELLDAAEKLKEGGQ